MASTPSYLREINQRRIFESVMRLRQASRAQISRVSGISSPTVGRIVDGLLNAGILMESETERRKVIYGSISMGTDGESLQPASAVGRPSTPLELDCRRWRFLAIQLGVRQTRLARTPIALPDEDSWEASFPTPATAGEWAEQLARHAVNLPISELQAVVVSVPGVVDDASGRILLSPNLRWTESADLRSLIEQSVARGVAVILVQEIRALAIGHHTTKPGSDDMLLVDFGSGVGGAAMIGGQLYSGPLPMSGEIGHTPVLGNTRPCGCGSVGCVETLVSRRGLLASARAHDATIKDWPDVMRLIAGNGMPNWLKHALDATAVCIAASLNNFGLRQVVLTGALHELPEAVADYLTEAVRANTMWARFGTIDVYTAPRRRLAGMVHTAISQTVLCSPIDL